MVSWTNNPGGCPDVSTRYGKTLSVSGSFFAFCRGGSRREREGRITFCIMTCFYDRIAFGRSFLPFWQFVAEKDAYAHSGNHPPP